MTSHLGHAPHFVRPTSTPLIHAEPSTPARLSPSARLGGHLTQTEPPPFFLFKDGGDAPPLAFPRFMAEVNPRTSPRVRSQSRPAACGAPFKPEPPGTTRAVACGVNGEPQQ